MQTGTDPIAECDDFDPFAGNELERVVPTTESQREIWLAAQLGREGSLAYNQVTALRLSGELQPAALGNALQALADRHESLRATLSSDGLALLIARSVAVPVDVVDLASLDESAQSVSVDQLCARAVEAPFDLASGPLLRAQLLLLGPLRNVLLLATHHIVCDGWSLGVIAKDLAVFYALECGATVSPPPLADRFSDYAAKEDSLKGEPSHASHGQYWLSRFEGELPRLDLPLDYQRPAVRTFASRREDRVLDATLVQDLRRLGASAGTSLFNVLAGGFAALLARISGQNDIVVGVPSAGQSRSGMNGLVGHCVNLLPIRFHVEPAQGAVQWVASTRELMLDALEHQQYTFGTLLHTLQIARDPSRVPLVAVMFNLDQPFELGSFGVPQVKVDPLPVPRHFEAFELFLNIGQSSSGLRLECQYNTDLFAAPTVRRWLASYEALLRGAVEAPSRPLAKLNVLDAEQLSTLAAWNRTLLVHDRSLRVQDLIEAQAQGTPHRAALTFKGRTLTYGQLQSQTNCLAQAMRARGLGRGARAGLCLERDLDMVVAQLAVLKAGAAYVPLDPGFPGERLAYMAEDAGLSALVTKSTLAGLIPWPSESTLLLDGDAAWISQLPDTALPADHHDARPDDPAYVIYTSGSTGKPKGTVVPHRAVVSFLVAMAAEPGITPDDTLVAVTTLSFDIAVLELLLPLTVGARVVVASREIAGDGHALAGLLTSCGATMMQGTPSTWQLLIEAGWEGSRAFRCLVGGESLRIDLAEKLLVRSAAVWNMYGPTETTVWSTCWKVEQPRAGISIGKPIANTRVRVVDGHGQLCVIGAAGEICIGGEGVAIGYLDRPELTADRFVADPAAEHAGSRTYRTGDRGRWRHDGNLEHLGRLDQQVKVRGHRIELGEIESNLASHPDIGQCVVVTREDRPGDVRIVAYVVARSGADVSAAALRDHLRRTLPDYMMPQHFVEVDEVPLLPNGKIDRKALARPSARIVQETRVAPRSETEAALAALWAEVLDVEEVGVHDTFFDLGGHSLLALKLIHRIEQEFKRTIRLATLFEAPTVSRLAVFLSGETIAPPATCAVPIKGAGRRAPLFFVSGWGGAIIGFKALARELPAEQPLYVLDTTKFGSATHPMGSLREIAARMIQDMRRIQPEGPYHLCGFSQGGKFVYEMAQALTGAGEAVALLALMDCNAPGYPRTRPALSRLMMHLRRIMTQSRSDNLAYLGSRLSYFYRHLTRQDTSVFGGDTDVAATSAAQAIQASADALTQAWADYQPAPYPGKMLLMTAGIRDFRPSLIDDDPSLGWHAINGNHLALRTMNAHHSRMIYPEHATELAAILADFLEKDPIPVPAVRPSATEPSRARPVPVLN